MRVRQRIEPAPRHVALGRVAVALLADRRHRGPANRDQRAGTAAGKRRRAIEAARPFGRGEILIAPQVRATVVPPAKLDAAALRGQSVVVLAGVDRLAPAETAALGRFLDAGGGVLIAPGDRADAAFYDGLDWMPC